MNLEAAPSPPKDTLLADGLTLLAAAGLPRKYHQKAAAGILVWKIGQVLWKKFNRPVKVIQITIDHENPHHRWMSIWMSVTEPENANTNVSEYTLAGSTDNTRIVPKGTLIYDFNGEKVMVETKSKQSTSEGGIRLSSHYQSYPSEMVITFGTTDKSIAKRFLDHIRSIGEKHDRQPMVRVWKWHDWVDVKPIPRRMPVLPGKMFETLTEDVTAFLGKKSWYEDTGIPWRRGYLFYGIPGSGKTTTAIALANFMGCDIYIMDLSQCGAETLLNAMNSVPAGSILLLEDLDCAFDDRERSEVSGPTGGSSRLTLSTFLNALDGVATKDGRILVATTNHKDKLDEAITRRGRLDRDFHFGTASTKQILELAERFGVPLLNKEAQSWSGQKSMADVQEKLLEILNNQQ